jgi:hypothetical protein
MRCSRGKSTQHLLFIRPDRRHCRHSTGAYYVWYVCEAFRSFSLPEPGRNRVPISATCSRRDDDVRPAAPSRYRLSLQPLLERSSDLGRAEQRSPSQLKISDISLSLQFPKKPRTYSATRKKNLETGFRVDIPLDAQR